MKRIRSKQKRKRDEKEKEKRNLDGGFVRRLVLLGEDLLEIDRRKERMLLDCCHSFWGRASESLLGIFHEKLFLFFQFFFFFR